jgi:CRP/FNR family cyclic AMP-dependent transcriptional regulator
MDRLDGDGREHLFSLGVVRRYPARSFVMTEGEQPATVAVVRTGLLRISKTGPDGRAVLLALRGPGDIVGELSALDTLGRSASVSTVVTSELLVMHGERFAASVRERPDFAAALIDLLAGRVRELSRQVVELAVGDAIGRVCGRLVELAGEDRIARLDTDGRVEPFEILLPISQEELAAWAGLSREAVVKALRRLRDLGWIRTGRRSVTILDLAAVYHRSPNAS